jgi:ElaB/YqjD/DUF883 family membrane-anchored ribosome-binding protein
MTVKSTASPALDEVVGTSSESRTPIDAAMDELTERANKVAQETMDNLRARAQPYVEQAKPYIDQAKPYIERARPYVDDAGEHIAAAERYIVERVRKQPLTTSLAILGVGVLLGLVLSGGRSR